MVLDTLEYGSAIKKTPVVVGNCTGFAVNRVFFPYTQAACLLVDLGLDPYKIDMAIYAGFGMPMGPFRWALSPQQPSLPLDEIFQQLPTTQCKGWLAQYVARWTCCGRQITKLHS